LKESVTILHKFALKTLNDKDDVEFFIVERIVA